MNPPVRPHRDERGVSVSVLFAALVPTMMLIAGLAVDGSAHSAAERRAEVAAAHAARAGSDAGAGYLLLGQDPEPAALRAARQVLSASGIEGDVSVQGDQLRVTTRTSAATVFLSIIGIDRLFADGRATALLRAR